MLTPAEFAYDVVGTLREFGQIIPQFNGQTAFAITRKPGYEALPYSQSMNGIGPHTEAPYWCAVNAQDGHSPSPSSYLFHFG